ncbi:MAG: tRNA (adenosine(37)-N6)-dimethylallyltransferase MiaA [Ruminococcaceae bacterium]|nr:tRNA (adenosine(37)-N6)-dimethylallyltransferase MiaA [Oscillospiraceae bacterium]
MTVTRKQGLIAVVGSTASGKSQLAVLLAQRLGGEVVSCDSMQIYRRMTVGTAKPTPNDMGGIPHHLIDFIEPDLPYSCADYVRDAKETLASLDRRGVLPVVCGGTGLYLDRLLCGTTTEELPQRNHTLREQYEAVRLTNGNQALHDRLRAVDPESADTIHPNNYPRVMRALEIFELTGVPKSQWDKRSLAVESPYRAAVIGLRYCDRQLLYRRIDARVDTMLKAGLLEETSALLAEGVFERNTTAAQAIGYKELLRHLRGEESLAEAVERLKLATRHYAKRQITWFGAKNYVHWINADRNGEPRPSGELLEEALTIAEKVL